MFIQIRWLVQTAETEKKHFEQGVKLSIDLTMHQIMDDPKLCSNIQSCLLDSMCQKVKTLRKLEWQKIDSILKSNLDNYGINCEYQFDLKFQIKKANRAQDSTDNLYCSENLRHEYQKGNLQMEMILPDKNSFIKKRIGPIFISSILLILLVAASFIFTLRIYFKEEKRASLIKNFIHNMAHEFKTPVAVIGLANSRLKKNIEISEDEKLLKYTEIIDNEKVKIQNHLTAILDLAYFEGKNTLLEKENVVINELIEASLKNINPILEEKNASISYKKLDKDISIYCSKTHIINSLTNIMDNACKYSNGNLKLKINTFEENKNLIVEIEDNGIGIAPKDLPYVFDKYFRVNTGNIHNIKGYGIGLSYVKEVISLHGGSVGIESKYGKGSTFTIILPINNNHVVKN